jgi:hypothetical protein
MKYEGTNGRFLLMVGRVDESESHTKLVLQPQQESSNANIHIIAEKE